MPTLALGERLECVDPVRACVLAESEEDHAPAVCHAAILTEERIGPRLPISRMLS
jgi:hypothetical protein